MKATEYSQGALHRKASNSRAATAADTADAAVNAIATTCC
jgi:hypothetical protein